MGRRNRSGAKRVACVDFHTCSAAVECRGDKLVGEVQGGGLFEQLCGGGPSLLAMVKMRCRVVKGGGRGLTKLCDCSHCAEIQA
jgi:hypothetical protein